MRIHCVSDLGSYCLLTAEEPDGATDVAGVKACTRAGTVCGSCVGLVKDVVGLELKALGVEASSALCEHFDLSRAEMFEVVRVRARDARVEELPCNVPGRCQVHDLVRARARGDAGHQ